MIIDKKVNIIDNFDTQVRYLPLLGQIMREIGDKTVAFKLLEQKMQHWSIEKTKSSHFYKTHNGILTHKTSNKPTTAFKFYIDFLLELKLIIKTGELIRCSKYGIVFNALDSRIDRNGDFSNFEKVFYLFYLLKNDADALLVILDFINETNTPVHKNIIAKKYNSLMKIRLEHKLVNSESPEIRNKYLSLVRTKKETKTVSKRIIPPRVEWLTDFGILNEVSEDTYSFSSNGKIFYDLLPKNDLKRLNVISEVNNKWFNSDFFSAAAQLFGIQTKKVKIDYLLSKYLPLSYECLNTDSVARISALPAFIFISVLILINENTVLNFVQLKEKLLPGFIVGDKKYSLREAARINESYILINLQ